MNLLRGSPLLVIVGGPNGAGKSTFIRQYVAEHDFAFEVLNADDIARRLQGAGARRTSLDAHAARELLGKIELAVRDSKNLVIESTLSGRAYAHRIAGWQSAGYRVVIHYLRLASVDASIARVQQRVISGGHDVPGLTLKRRFGRSWSNFDTIYKLIVDAWYLRRSEQYDFPLEDYYEGDGA